MKSINCLLKRIISVLISIMMCLGFVTPVAAANQKHITFSYTYFKHPEIARDSSGQYYISYYNFVQKEAYMDVNASDSAVLARGVALAPLPSMLFNQWTESYRDYSDPYNADFRMETKFSGSHVVFVLVDATKTTVVNGMRSYYYGDAEVIEKHTASGLTIALPTGSGRFHNARVASDVESNNASRVYPGDRYLDTKESRYHVIVMEADPGAEIVKAKSLKLSPTKRTMSLGESFNITPIISPSNATYQNVSWSSSNTSVAVVDANGLVTCVGPGNCKITAQTTDGSNKKAYCNITGPKPATGVSLKASQKIISRGGKVDIYATVKPVGKVYDTSVQWSCPSNNATIDDHRDGTCTVTCVGPGNVKIQALTHNLKKGTITITGPKQASSVSLKSSKKKLALNDEATIFATVSPKNVFDETVRFEPASINAKVTDNGDGTCTVQCTGEGNVKVKAITVTNKTKTITITGPKKASSVSLKSDLKKMAKGDVARIDATVNPKDAINKSVTWDAASDNFEFVEKGDTYCRIRCTDAGNIKVKATTVSNNKKKTITITGPKRATGVSLKADKKLLALNDEAEISATVTPKDAINKTVSWVKASDNVEIIEEGDGKCKIKCIGEGNVKVTATTVTNKSKTITIPGPKPATSVSIRKSSYTLKVGEPVQATATVNPKNVIYNTVEWSSDDPSIATVSPEGVITAVAPGKTYIYAKAYNGKVGKCTVTVKE